MSHRFTDAALLLVGHGSTVNADSSRPTREHAETLRRQGCFAEVATAYWKEHPTLVGGLRQTLSPRVFVVPLFISEGYFTEEVIPRELGVGPVGGAGTERVRQRGDRTIHYCHPVGTHPRMTGLILDRARDIVRRHPAPEGSSPTPAETTLFIAGHGTGNNENSRKAIEDQVDAIRRAGLYADVHPLFMEEEPRIGDCYGLAATENLVVVPFFISDGLHSYEDIPVMLGEDEAVVQRRFRTGETTWLNPTSKQGKRVWYSPGIGRDPSLVEVILERVNEAASWDANAS